jgi:muramoyltetrapeptide carboxypeptidase
MAELAAHGLVPDRCPTTWADDGRTAGPREARAAALTAAFRDCEVRAVVGTVGGSGARDVVAHLDPAELAAHPTALMGYSDLGSILLWLHEHTGLTTFYGPAALPQFGEAGGCDPYTWRHAWSALADDPSGGAAPVELAPAGYVVVEYREWDVSDDVARRPLATAGRRAWRTGSATAPVVAANIATLAGDLRAGIVPRSWAGRAVFLEESDTARWEDFCAHLDVIERANLLDGAACVVFGVFPHLVTGQWQEEQVRDRLSRTVRGCAGPVVSGVEFGHTDPMVTLPLGAMAEIRAVAGEEPRLWLTARTAGGRHG